MTGWARRESSPTLPSSPPVSSPSSRPAIIVIGHVLGVVAAHERAVTLFPARLEVAGQVPLMVLMVAFTVGGLTLLSST